MEPGPLIASGRDSEIFEFGPGLVLRRARNARSLEQEARVMEYARSHGYPVPEVHELRANGTELVMTRLEGPTMLTAMLHKPWTIPRSARVLADLHDQLHEIPGPDWLTQVPDNGERLLHLDLHPLNVICTPGGPVVIDWTGAARGDGLTDIAFTWLLIACGEAPGNPVVRRVVGAFRRRFAATFVARYDRRLLVERLGPVADAKVLDANMQPTERAAMRALVARVEKRKAGGGDTHRYGPRASG